jgi:hypothetical protein
MSDTDLAPALENLLLQLEHSSRLEFLYKAVEDTQNTIRFIDTKAAFCVTLLSAMVVGVLQSVPVHPSALHRVSFFVFLGSVGLCLLICLRVIFPVIKPHSAPAADAGRVLPKYFIHQHKGHHWLRHTFSSSVDDVLADDHASYTAALSAASDADLLTAMCDELLMVSLIRQIKSDRLHAAIFSLILSIVCFMAVMIT